MTVQDFNLCCGDYDGVVVHVEQAGQISDRAVLTAADADGQLAWPIFTVFGALLWLLSFLLWRVGSGGTPVPNREQAHSL